MSFVCSHFSLGASTTNTMVKHGPSVDSTKCEPSDLQSSHNCSSSSDRVLVSQNNSNSTIHDSQSQQPADKINDTTQTAYITAQLYVPTFISGF